MKNMEKELNQICSDVVWGIEEFRGGYFYSATIVICNCKYEGRLWIQGKSDRHDANSIADKCIMNAFMKFMDKRVHK